MAARNLASKVVLLEKQNNTVQLMTEIKTKKNPVSHCALFIRKIIFVAKEKYRKNF